MDGVEQGLELAFEDAVQLVQGEPHPMVRDSGLGKVVGADALAAPGAPHLGAAFVGALLGGPLSLLFEQARAQDFQRPYAVLVLRFFVLALHGEAAREVGDAHRRVRGVDALSPGPAGAHHVDAKLSGVDVHFHLAGLGQDRDGDGGGVDPPLGLGFRHALDAVDAPLVLEAAEDAWARDRGDRLSDAPGAAFREGEDLEFPAPQLGVAGVHAQQIPGEEGGFLAAGSGAELEHGVALVVGIRRDQQAADLRLDLRDFALEVLELAAGELCHVGVGIGEELLGLGAGAVRAVVALSRGREWAQLG